MTLGLVGRKCGMTRVFQEDGSSVPVTVIEIEGGANKITQVKTLENDGYCAIQVTAGQGRVSRTSKPLAGHYAKANVTVGRGLWEFRLNDEDKFPGEGEFKVGAELTVALFNDNQFVDVQGVTKGKGFAGVVKRYNFATQDATHGNSLSHRAPGSIGQNQFPGRVFKGKKMAGHMGAENCTVQSQEIVKVDNERNLLLIKGAIPGAPGGKVIVLPACKKSRQKEKS
jgi:large subunit ribosomal protein L3